jgi:SAM-dependent methyltransferase
MEHSYIKKYYDFERNHWWFTVREKIILQQLKSSLPDRRDLRILNVGAATGRSSQMLEQFGQVISVEKDQVTCLFLQSELKLEAIQASIESLPFEEESFDVICLFDVIEHVQEEGLAIDELYRICKKGGLLYCTTPAFSFLWSNHDVVNHHFRRYTRTRLGNVLKNKKFKVEYQSYFNFFLFLPIVVYRAFNRLIAKPKVLISDFEYSKVLGNRFFSAFFRIIFKLEIFLLRHLTLPFGVSILCRAKK